MPIGILAVGSITVCCLGLISAGPQEQESSNRYNNYMNLVQINAPKGQLCFVLFIDTHDSERSRALIQSSLRMMESYVTARIEVCFVCYKAYPRFLGNILTECDDISKEEREARVKTTPTGKCATVLAIIGSK